MSAISCDPFPYTVEDDELISCDDGSACYLETTRHLVITYEITGKPIVVGKLSDSQVLLVVSGESLGRSEVQPLDVSDVVWCEEKGLYVNSKVVHIPVVVSVSFVPQQQPFKGAAVIGVLGGLGVY